MTDGGFGPAAPSDWAAILKRNMAEDTPTRALSAPRRVRPAHRIMVMLHEAGLSQKEIAAATKYTEARVSVILNSRHPDLATVRQEFAAKVANNVLDVNHRVKLYANEMLDITVRHARNFADAANSRLAARDILQMAGFTPVKKQMNLNADVPISELRGIVGAIHEANEAAARAGELAVKQVEPRRKESAVAAGT